MSFICHTDMLQVLQVHVSTKIIEVQEWEVWKFQHAANNSNLGWDEDSSLSWTTQRSFPPLQVTNELLVHWDKASVLPWSYRKPSKEFDSTAEVCPLRVHKQCKKSPKPLSRNTIHHRNVPANRKYPTMAFHINLLGHVITKNDDLWS